MSTWVQLRTPNISPPFSPTTWGEVIRHFVKKHGMLPLVEQMAVTDPRTLCLLSVDPSGSIQRTTPVSFWEGCCDFIFKKHNTSQRVQILADKDSKELNEACFDFVFHPDPDGTPLVDQMQATITHIVDHLDLRLRILPWYCSNTSRPLKGKRRLPLNLAVLLEYFWGIDTTVIDHKVYIQVWLMLHINPLTLLTTQDARLAGWGRLANMQIYLKPLSTADDPVEIGWLAYSGNFTDTAALTSLVQQMNLDSPNLVDIGFCNKKLTLLPNDKKAQ